MSSLRATPGLIFMVGLATGTAMLVADNVLPRSPDLLGVKTVYILPKRSGFDQYLANELTSRGVIRVVTDPHRADAVLTDHLGQSFQERMDDLFPPPPKPKAKPSAKVPDIKPDIAKPDDGKVDDSKPDAVKPVAKDEAEEPNEEPAGDYRPTTSGISGKGNVFLVGREGRLVLWSDFRNPRSRQPKDMKRAADSVASDLKHALQPPDSGSK
jgi:hypothetical protein